MIEPGAPHAPSLPTIAHSGNAHPMLLQEARQQLAYLAIIVNDENVWNDIHRASIEQVPRSEADLVSLRCILSRSAALGKRNQHDRTPKSFGTLSNAHC